MVKRVALLLLLSILALTNATYREEHEISHVAEDLKGRLLEELEEGRSELRRCGERNSCSDGLECVRIGIYKRCIPRQDCMALEMKAFQERFDTDSYKQMLLGKAGVTEVELVDASQGLKTKDALLQNRAISSFIDAMQTNPGAFDEIDEIVRTCSLPDPDRYLRKLTTATTTTRMVPSRLSYSFFSGTKARQPTEAETKGLVVETEKFYRDTLKALYPSSFKNFTISTPVITFSSLSDYPVAMEFDAKVEFTTTDFNTPTSSAIFSAMELANYERYVRSYVLFAAPKGGLFFSTQRVIFSAPIVITPAPAPTGFPTHAPTLVNQRSNYVGVQLEGGVGFDGSLSFIWELIPGKGSDSSTFGKMYARYCLGVGLQAGAAVNFIVVWGETPDPEDIECLSAVYDLDFGIGMTFGYALGVCLLQEPPFLFQEITMGLGLGASLSGFSMCQKL